MKKVLVLEDNPIMLSHLCDIIRKTDTRNEIYSFDNITEAYQCALEKTMDLFVVDIILDTSRPGDASGLKFVENIRKIKQYGFVPVIFITSLEDAKLYTYEKLHCYRFIEKPFDVEQLKRLINECLDFPGSNAAEKTLYFRKEGIILAVDREDIAYVEIISHILHIHTRNKDTMKIPYITIRKFLDEADSCDFIQCSRNAVINKKFILNIDFSNRIIQMKDGLGRVDIGIMYKKYIKEWFT